MCADRSLAHCDDLWGNTCVTLTEAEQAVYPGLAMELSDGVTLQMSAKDYLLYGNFGIVLRPNFNCHIIFRLSPRSPTQQREVRHS